jgi:hypothetical protein
MLAAKGHGSLISSMVVIFSSFPFAIRKKCDSEKKRFGHETIFP